MNDWFNLSDREVDWVRSAKAGNDLTATPRHWLASIKSGGCRFGLAPGSTRHRLSVAKSRET